MEPKENRAIERMGAGAGQKGLSPLYWVADLFKQAVVREWMLALVIFLTIVGILQIELVPKSYQIKVGELSQYDIVAPRTMVNTFKTNKEVERKIEELRDQASEHPEWQMVSRSAGTDAFLKVSDFFNVVEKYREQVAGSFDKMPAAQKYHLLQRFRQDLSGINPRMMLIKDSEIITLLTLENNLLERVRKETRQVLTAVETRERISSNNLETIRAQIGSYIQNFPIDEADRDITATLVRYLIFPNLELDDVKIQAQAQRIVKTSMVVKGQPILMKGDLVTEEQYQLLKDCKLVETKGNRLLISLALGIFSLFLMGIGLLYLYLYKRSFLKQEKMLYLLALIAIIILVVAKVLTLPKEPSLYYLIPVALASILFSVLLDYELALVFTVLLSLFVAVIAGYDLSLAIYYILSGGAAIFSVYRMANWKQLLRTTIIVAAVNFFAIITLGLLFGGNTFQTIISFGAMGLANALLSTVFANGILPFLEHIFGITSSFSLLELSNPSQPLLKRLLIEAPGTYHHSIIVGNLAEAAAEAIGADKLLVRVGAYYHDVGKIRRPYFFVENQIAQDNPHEKLSPSLSTLIIISHVKDGVELAKEYGLPAIIRDIIEQHHGTDLIRYFFHRAAEVYQEEKETVLEADYCYPGPKPQTKEAALVMLADSVEAAARAMSKPTPAKIEGLVQRIMQERMESHQFDECNLTFRDLDRIKTAFLKVLGGIFHHRIEYPEAVIKEMERKRINAGSHS